MHTRKGGKAAARYSRRSGLPELPRTPGSSLPRPGTASAPPLLHAHSSASARETASARPNLTDLASGRLSQPLPAHTSRRGLQGDVPRVRSCRCHLKDKLIRINCPAPAEPHDVAAILPGGQATPPTGAMFIAMAQQYYAIIMLNVTKETSHEECVNKLCIHHTH
ncbi:hypothetical protein NDU88_005544 [Pleurodeles waltl]|uniref:Uncharacterized protein n=1 Tax=Pleurodeles waltl TaxID=8319 RepID=A0AAV7PG14_PLEWA|nr:hypothetical protein NDU88_005544 [Pleurodeles waltl]